MNEIDIVSTIDSVLGILAERFGSSVEHLWALMIRQAYIEGAALLVLTLILPFITLRMFKWYTTVALVKHDRYDNMTDENTLYSAIGAVVLFFLWFIAITNFTSMLTALINPEMYALKEIFSMLSGS